jgi:hypothetical protein
MMWACHRWAATRRTLSAWPASSPQETPVDPEIRPADPQRAERASPPRHDSLTAAMELAEA